jgi:hypothetical protein
MLDKRLKWAFFLVTLIFAGIPLTGIFHDEIEALFEKLGAYLRAGHQQVTVQGNDSAKPTGPSVQPSSSPATSAETIKEDMVFIPAGEFLRGCGGCPGRSFNGNSSHGHFFSII